MYNSSGPEGNSLLPFSEIYLTDRHPNEWGQAVNIDGSGAQGVREFLFRTSAIGAADAVWTDCAWMPCMRSTTTVLSTS